VILKTLQASLHYLVRQQSRYGADLTAITLQRLVYLAVLAVPVSALHILFFAQFEANSDAEDLWRTSIMAVHTGLIIVIAALGFSAFRLLKAPDSNAAGLVVLLSLAAVLSMGISLTAFDQLVTPAVTPFLVVCTIVGAVFLLSPFASLIFFPAAFIAFYLALGQTQPDATILLSNRVNGMTATGIGLGLSLMLWHTKITHLQQARKIASQKKALELSNHKLRELATHDELTGLANRRSFDTLIRDEIALMKRNSSEACLLMLDLDHFKQVNDIHGHLAGDELLKELAALLTASVRATDLVGRWGGEEFVILLRDTGEAGAREVAENLRRKVAEHAFAVTGKAGSDTAASDEPLKLTASIGIASLDPSSPDAIQLAYSQADRAMYAAKAAGRNTVISETIATESGR
tara:strand:+ start:253917 stop:255134 length:1218 start_codon:yes stop_codon:yes gene_type:complete